MKIVDDNQQAIKQGIDGGDNAAAISLGFYAHHMVTH